MLNLILGRKLSGKTSYCIKKASELALSGKDVILLVPEQFNFECQKLLLAELGPTVSNKISIHSFTSLCREISSCVGGLAGTHVDECIRFLLVGRALFNCRDHLKYYARYYNSTDFQKKIAAIISELKQASVSADDLIKFSQNVSSNVFADKLGDISLILSAYDALLCKNFVEPFDIIQKTVDRMNNSNWFKSKTLIIDEFKGFTASQLLLLDRAIAGCDDVYAAFCCDTEVPFDDVDIFKNVAECINSLKSSAKSHNVMVASTIIAQFSGYKSDDLRHLELFSSGRTSSVYNGQADNISIINASSSYDEVNFCMNTIRKLVRNNGYRYSDFVIISRKESPYANFVKDISLKYNIPCFVDKKMNLGELPISVFITSAVSAALSFETTDILRFLKTGFANVDNSDVSEIENYAYIWNINSSGWLKQWSLNPLGLKGNKNSQSFDNSRLNNARELATAPLIMLKNGLKGTVLDMCKCLIKFIENCELTEKLKLYTLELEAKGEYDLAQYQRVGYDAFISVLDKLCAVSGDDVISPEDFSTMLNTALFFADVGEIPYTKEQVVFGTADRIRPLRPKIVFVLGANHEIFPASVGQASVFSTGEREKMIDFGFKIADCGINDTIDEKFLFYNAVNCASDKVFISYSSLSVENTEMLPSNELNEIMSAFADVKKYEYGFDLNINFDDLECADYSFEKLTQNFNSDEPIVFALKEYFKNNSEYSAKFSALQFSENNIEPKLSKDVARRLYGDNLRLSPSKIEDYNKCHFAFFCKHGLKVRKVDKVDFTAATRGNIIHFCLEHFINNHKEDIGNLSTVDIKQEVFDLCDEYLKIMGVNKDDLGDKFDYMLSLLKDTAVIICISLNNEFAQSMFKPKFCELKIGKNELVKSVEVKSENGVSVSLEGTVDRVDTTDDGKVRVVDYKTGVKEFKLSAVLDGMNMQMLLYLYSLVENAKDILSATIPAGVLYFPARRVVSENAFDGFIKMNGLVDSDIDTVLQMESEGKGKIVPAKLKSNGAGFYSTEHVASTDDFKLIFKYLESVLAKIGAKITNGDIEIKPINFSQHKACDYCDYRSVCRINDQRNFREETKVKTADALSIMKNELEAGETSGS